MQNMKIRAILTVKGDVQGVGFRVAIQKTALKMGITGYTLNLKNGDVRIVCECEEDTLEKFIQAVKISDKLTSVYQVEKEIKEATGEYETFEIKFGDMPSEMVQGFITAGKYFDLLGQKVDKVGEKVDNLTVHTDEHFNKLDEKYHAVSETLLTMNEGQKVMYEELAQTRIELTKVVENLTVLVQSYVSKNK